MAKLVLFGTGRGADVAYRFLTADTDHEIVGFTVDEAYCDRASLRGLPLVPFEAVERRFPPDDFRMLVLLGYQGMNSLRALKFGQAKAKGYMLESYVASNIFRVEPFRVGENCFIMDNQSISLDVEIKNNVVMWSSNHVGDMSVIEDHAWVSSHVTIAASTRIGEKAFLGIGATIGNGVVIGAESFIGAQALVTESTAPSSVHLAGKGAIDAPSRAFMRGMTAAKKL